MASGDTEPSPNDYLEGDDINSFVSAEIALSFDHILEQIFQSLNLQDLLNCRFVSHRWLFFAQKPLQKQIQLTFVHNKKRSNENWYPTDDVFCTHLTELTNLLRQGQCLADSEGNGHIRTIVFPCSQFEFERVSLSNEDLQQFLNTNGENIRELFVNTYTTCPGDIIANENILMDEIGNLLLNQAPNLKILRLYIDSLETIEWKNENKNPGDNCLQTTDPEYKEICQKASDLLQLKADSSLKVLDLSGEGLEKMAKVVEFIIRISPNLEEIILGLDCRDWLYCQKYLLVPENRLSLLKEIIFNFDPASDHSSIENMEKVSFGNFRLKSFQIDLFYIKNWIPDHLDYESRITDMINRILRGSWDTLEEIRFEYITFLRGMRLPEVMPKVRYVVIQDSMEPNNAADANREVSVFPTGLNFQKTFPKLHWVHLGKDTESNNIRGFSSFLNCLHFGAGPLSMSVRRVTLSRRCFQKKPLPVLISQMIQQWFPNALIN